MSLWQIRYSSGSSHFVMYLAPKQPLLRNRHFRFHGPTPQALVEGREKTYFAYLWNDLAADKKRSLTAADRNAYVAAYSRPGRMRAGWAYFAAWPDTARISHRWPKRN
jgi:hypothetical protein